MKIKSIHFSSLLTLLLFVCASHSQTRIAKEQIEDAFILKNGGAVYGDLTAATSTIAADKFRVLSDIADVVIEVDGPHTVIRSNLDLYLDPTNNGTANAVIVPVTLMECPDYYGDKIRFYSHTYKIGVSPNDLDLTSDQNIKFHSDAMEDLFIISGDIGNASARNNLSAGKDVISGNVFSFANQTEGDKILLYGTLYRMGISPFSLDFYSDHSFKWHSDENVDAMVLNANSGTLSLKGSLKLPVYTSLPDGSVGELIYFDHTSDDNQDGAYIYTSAGWQQL